MTTKPGNRKTGGTVISAIIKRLAKLTDNPVLIFLLHRYPVIGRFITAQTLVPILSFLGILVLAPMYTADYYSLVMSYGQAVFLGLSAVYFIHCIWMGGNITMADPLALSFREKTADQLVITGFSPATWLMGHLFYVFNCWLYIAPVYLSVMAVSWLLGGATLVQLVAAIMMGGVVVISTRLLYTMLVRTSLHGLVWLAAFFGAVLLSVARVVLALGSSAEQVIPPLFIQVASPMYPLLQCIRVSSSTVLIQMVFARLGDNLQPVYAFLGFMGLHLLFWATAISSVLVGWPASRFTPPSGYGVAKRKVIPTAINLSLLKGGNEALGRTANWGTIMRMFHQNSRLRYPMLWEWVSSVAVTLGNLVLLSSIYSFYLSPAANIESQGILNMSFVICCLVLFNIGGVCFSKENVVVAGKLMLRRVLPFWINWGVRSILCISFVIAAGVNWQHSWLFLCLVICAGECAILSSFSVTRYSLAVTGAFCNVIICVVVGFFLALFQLVFYPEVTKSAFDWYHVWRWIAIESYVDGAVPWGYMLANICATTLGCVLLIGPWCLLLTYRYSHVGSVLGALIKGFKRGVIATGLLFLLCCLTISAANKPRPSDQIHAFNYVNGTYPKFAFALISGSSRLRGKIQIWSSDSLSPTRRPETDPDLLVYGRLSWEQAVDVAPGEEKLLIVPSDIDVPAQSVQKLLFVDEDGSKYRLLSSQVYSLVCRSRSQQSSYSYRSFLCSSPDFIPDDFGSFYFQELIVDMSLLVSLPEKKYQAIKDFLVMGGFVFILDDIEGDIVPERVRELLPIALGKKDITFSAPAAELLVTGSVVEERDCPKVRSFSISGKGKQPTNYPFFYSIYGRGRIGYVGFDPSSMVKPSDNFDWVHECMPMVESGSGLLFTGDIRGINLLVEDQHLKRLSKQSIWQRILSFFANPSLTCTAIYLLGVAFIFFCIHVWFRFSKKFRLSHYFLIAWPIAGVFLVGLGVCRVVFNHWAVESNYLECIDAFPEQRRLAANCVSDIRAQTPVQLATSWKLPPRRSYECQSSARYISVDWRQHTGKSSYRSLDALSGLLEGAEYIDVCADGITASLTVAEDGTTVSGTLENNTTYNFEGAFIAIPNTVWSSTSYAGVGFACLPKLEAGEKLKLQKSTLLNGLPGTGFFSFGSFPYWFETLMAGQAHIFQANSGKPYAQFYGYSQGLTYPLDISPSQRTRTKFSIYRQPVRFDLATAFSMQAFSRCDLSQRESLGTLETKQEPKPRSNRLFPKPKVTALPDDYLRRQRVMVNPQIRRTIPVAPSQLELLVDFEKLLQASDGLRETADAEDVVRVEAFNLVTGQWDLIWERTLQTKGRNSTEELRQTLEKYRRGELKSEQPKETSKSRGRLGLFGKGAFASRTGGNLLPPSPKKKTTRVISVEHPERYVSPAPIQFSRFRIEHRGNGGGIRINTCDLRLKYGADGLEDDVEEVIVE